MTPAVGFRVDYRAFEQEFGEATRLFEEQVSRELYRAADGAVVDARSTDLFEDRTGELRAKLGFVGRGPFDVQLQANARHSSFVHNGTPPHVIEAKGKALAFQLNGAMVFRKRVHHPGTAPRPFLQIAADDAGARLAERIEHLVSRTLG